MYIYIYTYTCKSLILSAAAFEWISSTSLVLLSAQVATIHMLLPGPWKPLMHKGDLPAGPWSFGVSAQKISWKQEVRVGFVQL